MNLQSTESLYPIPSEQLETTHLSYILTVLSTRRVNSLKILTPILNLKSIKTSHNSRLCQIFPSLPWEVGLVSGLAAAAAVERGVAAVEHGGLLPPEDAAARVEVGRAGGCVSLFTFL